MKKSQKILFFGNERLATGVTSSPRILQALISNSYNVHTLLLHSAPPKDEKSKELSAILAEQNNIDVVYITSKQQLIDVVTRIKPDIGVLAAFGAIIPGSVIDMIPGGILNLHPSLLPRHRGSTPIEQTILSGDAQAGVSIMKLDAGMDTGDIYSQKSIDLAPHTSKQDLVDLLHTLGTEMLLTTLGNLSSLSPKQQSPNGITTTKKITKQDGVIDWNEPADVLERQIRAYAGWPRSLTSLNSISVVINSAYSSPAKRGLPGTIEIHHDKKLLSVNTGNGTLYIQSLTPVGKKEMPISAFLNGYKNKL